MAVFTNRTRDFGFGDLNGQNVVRVVRDNLRLWHSRLRPLSTGQSTAGASAPGTIRLPLLGIKRITGLVAARLERMCSSYPRLGWDPRPSR